MESNGTDDDFIKLLCVVTNQLILLNKTVFLKLTVVIRVDIEVLNCH